VGLNFLWVDGTVVRCVCPPYIHGWNLTEISVRAVKHAQSSQGKFDAGRLFPNKNSFRKRVSYPTEIKKIRVG
jgi:hypothetical protein